MASGPGAGTGLRRPTPGSCTPSGQLCASYLAGSTSSGEICSASSGSFSPRRGSSSRCGCGVGAVPALDTGYATTDRSGAEVTAGFVLTRNRNWTRFPPLIGEMTRESDDDRYERIDDHDATKEPALKPPLIGSLRVSPHGCLSHETKS